MFAPQGHDYLSPAPDILRYGESLTGGTSGRAPVQEKDWIGNRKELSAKGTVIRPGHGNQIDKKEGEDNK